MPDRAQPSPSPLARPLVLVLVPLLITAAFLLGRSLPTSTNPLSLQPSSLNPQPSSTALDTQDALAQLQTAFESGDEFTIHYTAATLAHDLDTDSLAQLFASSGTFTSPHASIAKLILALELARRSPQRLATILEQDDFAQTTNFDTRLLFNYLAKSYPESTLDLALLLSPQLRSTALSGMARSGNPRAADLAYSQLAAINTLAKQEALTERHTKLLQDIESQSWIADPEQFNNDFLIVFRNQPQEGVKLALTIDDPVIRTRMVRTMLRQRWSHPIEALELIKNPAQNQLTFSSQQRLNEYRTILSRIPKDQFDSTIDWISQNLSRHEQNILLQDANNLAQANPLALLSSSLLNDAPDSPAKSRATQHALEALASSQDLTAAIQFLESQDQNAALENHSAYLLPQAFTQGGAASVTSLFQQLDSPKAKRIGITALAKSWGSQDPLTFLEWAAASANPTSFNDAALLVSENWASTNAQEAATFAEALPNNETKKSIQRKIGRALNQISPISAIEYASQVEDPKTSWSILADTGYNWNQVEPDVATPFFLETYTPDETSAGYLSAIIYSGANNWSQTEPQAAVAYFAANRDRDFVHSALAVSLHNWLEQDESTARAYFANTLDPTLDDPTRIALSLDNQIIKNYPDLAQQLFDSISESEEKAALANTFETLLENGGQ